MSTNLLLVILIILVGLLLAFLVITYIENKLVLYRMRKHEEKFNSIELPKINKTIFTPIVNFIKKYWNKILENLKIS